MNTSHFLTRPNHGTLAAVVALAAVLAAIFAVSLAAATDDAAASGGIGVSGGGGSGTAGSHSSEAKYDRLWDQVSSRNQRWAKRTARCESGGDPKAIGGGGLYRGAFQFMRSTWKASPKSPGGDPIDFSYTTQAVVAVKLKLRDGAGHWPVCG